ncbi:hypothetical protein D3C81_1698900 [compost metagenome]
MGRPSQISLLIGPALSDLKTLTETFLPKAAIDKTTSRMSDLIKQRFGTEQRPNRGTNSGTDGFNLEDLV